MVVVAHSAAVSVDDDAKVRFKSIECAVKVVRKTCNTAHDCVSPLYGARVRVQLERRLSRGWRRRRPRRAPTISLAQPFRGDK